MSAKCSGNGTAHPQAHDASGEHVNDEGHELLALPGRDIGEVLYPKLIRKVRLKLPIHPVERTSSLCITNGGAHGFAKPDASWMINVLGRSQKKLSLGDRDQAPL
jgi:hypothetical protein